MRGDKLIFARALAVFALLGLCAASARAQAETPTQAPPAVPASPESKPHVRIQPLPDGGAPENSGPLLPTYTVIDAPTASALDTGSFYVRSRFASGGGFLQYASFGVFRNLDIGASLALDGLIGRERSIRGREPETQIKYHFFDGTRYIPSFAIGYDGQGYDYNQTTKNYNERKRGLYVAAGQELWLPGLFLHPSINISDFNSSAFAGSLPLVYTYKDKVSLMLEWDNINALNSQSRLNAGLRFYVTQNFLVDVAVRDIGQKGDFSDGTPKGPERIVQLAYRGSF